MRNGSSSDRRQAIRRRSGRRKRSGLFGFRAELPEFRLSAFLPVLVIAAPLLWLAWRIIVLMFAFDLADTDPESALAWRSNESAALVNVAEERLAGDTANVDLDADMEPAKEALKASPLDWDALRLLAIAAEREGDESRAVKLMTLAGQRSLDSTAVDAWLFDHELRTGNLTRALDYADALLRGYPYLADRLFPVLIHVLIDKQATDSFVTKLQTNPPWRLPFLTAVSAQAPNPDTALKILVALKSGATPPTSGELRPYLDRLLKDELFSRAYFDWQEFLPERLDKTNYLYNGDFKTPPSEIPFDWLIHSGAGAEVGIETEDSGQHSLKVEFADQRVSAPLVSKLLVLSPGAYTFSARVRAEDLRNERGVWWRLRCVEGKEKFIGATERINGTLSWRSLEADFEVPATGCNAQWLTLEVAARASLEQAIGGAVWYDSVNISAAGSSE